MRLDNGTLVDVTAPNLVRPKNRTHKITWEEDVYLSWSASSPILLTK